MLNLDIVGRERSLVLPQSNMLDFLDSPREDLPSLRSRLGDGMLGKVEEMRGGEELGTGIGMENEKK